MADNNDWEYTPIPLFAPAPALTPPPEYFQVEEEKDEGESEKRGVIIIDI